MISLVKSESFHGALGDSQTCLLHLYADNIKVADILSNTNLPVPQHAFYIDLFLNGLVDIATHNWGHVDRFANSFQGHRAVHLTISCEKEELFKKKIEGFAPILEEAFSLFTQHSNPCREALEKILASCASHEKLQNSLSVKSTTHYKRKI